MLCRWALAIQEYDFTLRYRKGSLNGNADALSRQVNTNTTQCAVTTTSWELSRQHIKEEQKKDKHIRVIFQSLRRPNSTPTSPKWCQQPLRRYRQLWSQLKLIEGIFCREYSPGPTSDVISVPILPDSMHDELLLQYHNEPSAGHLGADKTLDHLRQVAYWVNMSRDVERHCQECVTCQWSKLPLSQHAPMNNIPVGRPWEMVAADIHEVPLSANNNRYLLVVQDYFTKWVEAVPIPNQTATRITSELVKLFSAFGLPNILHSDQGRNFESTLLKQTLEAFGIRKTHTTAYHPQGDGMVERFNRSLLQLLRTYIDKQEEWEQYLPLVLYAYRSAKHSSTGVSPFLLMFGRQPTMTNIPPISSFDTGSYQTELLMKLAELYDLVESNVAQAARDQKTYYDSHTSTRTF